MNHFFILFTVMALLISCEHNNVKDICENEVETVSHIDPDSVEAKGYNFHHEQEKQSSGLYAEFPLTEEKVPVNNLSKEDFPTSLFQIINLLEESEIEALVFKGTLNNHDVYLFYEGYLPGSSISAYDSSGSLLADNEDGNLTIISNVQELSFAYSINLSMVMRGNIMMPYVPVPISSMPEWIRVNHLEIGGTVAKGKYNNQDIYNIYFPFHSSRNGSIYDTEGNLLIEKSYAQYMFDACHWICVYNKEIDGSISTGINQINI